jgi:hypothetical protein
VSGGQISRTPVLVGGDDFFYNTEKAGTALALYRAGLISSNTALYDQAAAILGNALTELEGPAVFDKPGAKYTQRLATAVGFALRNAADPPPSLPSDPPNATPTPDPGGGDGGGGDDDDDGVNISSVTRKVKKGVATIRITATNLPAKFRVMIAKKKISYKAVSRQIFSFTQSGKNAKSKALKITITTANGQRLAVLVLNVKTGTWQQQS